MCSYQKKEGGKEKEGREEVGRKETDWYKLKN